jgi:hypothetical protein
MTGVGWDGPTDIIKFPKFSKILLLQYTLFLSPIPLSHKMTEALTDSSASKTF